MLNISWKKKRILLFFLLLVVLFLIPETSNALWPFDEITKTAKSAAESTLGSVASAMAVLIATIVLGVANFWLAISAYLLEWVISPDFISLSYTGLDNPVIKAGWNVTSNLANMGIVLALIVIGLATILRLESYQAKKTLPVLIIVALLINFAPVFLGVIVDASNILMNFLLEDPVGYGAFSNVYSEQEGKIKEAWASFGKTEGAPFKALGRSVAYVGFAIIAGLVFFLFTALFVFRYIAIWIAVILSPLAFVSYILPKTRAFFDMWWKQFLAWCFIGVFAAFFIYLSFEILEMASPDNQTLIISSQEADINAQIHAEEDTSIITDALNELLPYLIVSVFLIMGFFMAVSISAMGANTVVNLTKKAGKGATRGGRFVASRSWQRGIRPNIDRGLAKMSGGHLTTRKIAGGISHGVEKIPVARWFLPEKVRKYGQYGQAVDAAQARTKDYKSRTLAHRFLERADIEEQGTANLLEILQRGDAEDLFHVARNLGFGKTDEDILKNKKFQKIVGRGLQIAGESGKAGQITRRDPRLAMIAAESNTIGYKGLSAKQGVDKAVSEARGQHLADWEPEILQNKLVAESALAHFDRDRWLQVNRTVKNGQETALKAIDSAFSDFVDKNNIPAQTENQIERAWEQFTEDIERRFGAAGYFKAAEDKRMQQTGWRRGEYVASGKRWFPKTKKEHPTPGEAAGIPEKASDLPSGGRKGKNK